MSYRTLQLVLICSAFNAAVAQQPKVTLLSSRDLKGSSRPIHRHNAHVPEGSVRQHYQPAGILAFLSITRMALLGSSSSNAPFRLQIVISSNIRNCHDSELN